MRTQTPESSDSSGGGESSNRSPDSSAVGHVKAISRVLTSPSAAAQHAKGAALTVVSAFSLLKQHDFGLLWGGGLVSNIGSLMQGFAVQFLVFDLTKSPKWSGLENFAMWVPMSLLLPFGGVIADRFDQKLMLIVGNALLLLIAATLSILNAQGVIHVSHLIVAAVLGGAISGLMLPAYQAMLPRMVGQQNLPNAVALNALQYNISRVVGPMLGGFAMWIGATWCFGLNAASFVAVILAALVIRSSFKPAQTKHTPVLESLLSGFRYLYSRKDLLFVEITVVCMAFAISTLLSMLPALVAEYGFEKTDAASRLAWMMSVFGLGAVLGAAFNATRKKGAPSPWIAFPLLSVLAVTLVVIGLKPPFPLTIALVGLGGMMFMTSGNRLYAAVLASTPNEFRGRIASLHFIAFGTGLPFGGLIAGYLAEPNRLGILRVFEIYGIALAAVVIALFLIVRRYGVKFHAEGHAAGASAGGNVGH